MELEAQLPAGKHIVSFTYNLPRSDGHNSLIGVPNGIVYFTIHCPWCFLLKNEHLVYV